MRLRFITVALAALLSVGMSAQTPEEITFTKGEIDSTSFFLGINFGSIIKGYGFNGMSSEGISLGMKDFINAKGSPRDEDFIDQFKFNPNEMDKCLDSYLENETPSESQVDSASYYMGISFGSFVRSYGFPEPDYTICAEGINAFVNAEGDPNADEFVDQFRLNPDEMNSYLPMILEKQEMIILQGYLHESEQFLAQKKAELGLASTESGLLYKVIDPGKPGTNPRPEDTVTVLYKGTRMDGSIFDDHSDPSNPISFPLGRVIAGWTEGLQLIGVGGKMLLYLHPDLAYGSRGAGSDIAPNAALVFEITLVDVEKAEITE